MTLIGTEKNATNVHFNTKIWYLVLRTKSSATAEKLGSSAYISAAGSIALCLLLLHAISFESQTLWVKKCWPKTDLNMKWPLKVIL